MKISLLAAAWWLNAILAAPEPSVPAPEPRTIRRP